MDYVRASTRAKRRRRLEPKVRTGPMPTVPWRDLDRRASLEQHLPLLILLAFGILAAIQLLLVL